MMSREAKFDDVVADDYEDEPGFTASSERKDAKVEFHVQMTGYAQEEMRDLIVEAAARSIVGRHNASAMAKAIKARCVELITQAINERLASVTAEILDQPFLPQGDPSVAPMTMRDFIGRTGRDYLEQRIDYDGMPTKEKYYSKSRIQQLVEDAACSKYKRELSAATDAIVKQIQDAIRENYNKVLAEEADRLQEALKRIGR